MLAAIECAAEAISTPNAKGARRFLKFRYFNFIGFSGFWVWNWVTRCELSPKGYQTSISFLNGLEVMRGRWRRSLLLANAIVGAGRGVMNCQFTPDKSMNSFQCRKRVGSEWRLVKGLKFAGAAVPPAVAMGEFDKFPAWTIEQGKGFGSAFEGSWLGSSRTEGHQVAGQCAEQILPQFSFQPVRPGLLQHRAVLAQHPPRP